MGVLNLSFWRRLQAYKNANPMNGRLRIEKRSMLRGWSNLDALNTPDIAKRLKDARKAGKLISQGNER